ncbi:protein RRP5 [Carex littledalei]|uniref:Protein RRP5 n=1 Tax=Carex littledalei TaxID=544730 RepID=A0A833R665_9POAL|nr:protein RRP5 [Carex littledalei]
MELEISAAEERSLKKDVPKSEEEFEKLVRSSPNSSYVWINYMAFMLDVADVGKARSIAESCSTSEATNLETREDLQI